MSREDLDVSRTDQSPTRLHLRRFDTPCMAQSGEKDHGAAPGNHAWTKPAATALSSTRCNAATPAYRGNRSRWVKRVWPSRTRLRGLSAGPTTFVTADQLAEHRGLLACDGPDLLCHDDGVDDDLVLGPAR